MGFWRNNRRIKPETVADQVDRLIDRDFYNFKASNTRRWQRGLAAALAGTGSLNNVFIGGGQVYRRNLTTFPSLFRDRLAAAGLPVNGTGWVFSNDGLNNYDSRITASGTWAISLGYTTATAVNSLLTFVSNVWGTTAAVAYLNTSAPFTVSVNGAADVTVTPDGTSTVGIYSVTGLAYTKPTIKVTATSAAATQIVGFRVGDPNGVRVHNLAGFGWEAELYYSNPGATYPTAIINGLFPGGTGVEQGPDVVHAVFGMEDLYHLRTPDQLAVNLRLIRARFPKSDFILYTGMEHTLAGAVADPPTAAQPNLAPIACKIWDVADELDCPVVDIYHRAGGYAAAAANGLMADYNYPSLKGHALWASLAADAILGAPTGPPQSAPRGYVPSAAGTTTLIASDPVTTVVTGTTTQFVRLPQTGIFAGDIRVVDNQSTGNVSIQTASSVSVFTANPATMVAFRARVDSPTASGDWVPVERAISVTSAVNTVPQRDGGGGLSAAYFIGGVDTTATSNGTLPVPVSSAQTQRFTAGASPNHTANMPTTGVGVGWSRDFANDSTGTITVKSSNGDTIRTMAAGERCRFLANVATPTTSAHWTIFKYAA